MYGSTLLIFTILEIFFTAVWPSFFNAFPAKVSWYTLFSFTCVDVHWQNMSFEGIELLLKSAIVG